MRVRPRAPKTRPPGSRQDVERGGSIATHRIHPLRESGGEKILIDRRALEEHLHERAGHLGVVRPLPRRGRRVALLDATDRILDGSEEALAERVADRQSVERVAGATHALRIHARIVAQSRASRTGTRVRAGS